MGREIEGTFLPARSICVIMESSTTDEPAKLLPISINVGKLPVVKPLMRCSVVVGGSACALKMKDLSGYLALSSLGSVRTSWWCGDAGKGGEGEMKSNRRASMMRKTRRGWVAGRVHDEVSSQEVVWDRERRVRRKPEVKR